MPVYSVSHVVSRIKKILLSDDLLQDVWIRGEISNISRPGSGHTYFTLRDDSTSLRSVMFRYSLGIGAHLLEEGSSVVVHGRLAVYEVRGDVQCIVDMVQPEGLGELNVKLEKLKLKLDAEGLFETSRKRALPDYPKRIGVVTSPSGSVWRDIQTVVNRRYTLAELVLAPTPVQGESAVDGILDAFRALDNISSIDVVILARGGGSLEDLWPFNDESVARAVFGSRAPVISGVGHETDTTVVDMVADCRVSTPSAAAEMAVPDQKDLSFAFVSSRRAMSLNVSNKLNLAHEVVFGISNRLNSCRPDLDGERIRIDELLRSSAKYIMQDIQFKRERTDGLCRRLKSLSPDSTLRRGYAVVQPKIYGVPVLSDVGQISIGDSVNVKLAKGGFEAEVLSVDHSG